MSVNIHTPSIAKRWQITQGMWEDLIWDPVMACKVLLGYDLDVFQRCRLRCYWFFPMLIDSSGYSSGKTLVTWIYCQLRALLIQDQHIGVFYPTGEVGRNSFWNYYTECQSKIFHAQLGRLADDEDIAGQQKKMSRGAACYKAFYLSGSKVLLPAPGFARGAQTQASMRYNVVHLEEWTHVDANAAKARTISGIDRQIIGRATRPQGCFNKHHPVWANHIHFSAPAKPQQHPAWKRYYTMLKAANGIRKGSRVFGGGDPTRAVVSWSYKDWSRNRKCPTGRTWADQFADRNNVLEMRRQYHNDAEFLGEALGIWALSGSGWYSSEAMAQAQALGADLNLKPVLSRAMDEEENLMADVHASNGRVAIAEGAHG